MKPLAILLGLLSCGSNSFAMDLGVQANIWTISEIDIRQMMIESASRANVTSAQNDLAASTERYFDNLPKRTLPSVTSTKTVWIDPTIELTGDIQVPVKGNDGKYTVKVLYPTGTKVNPLVTHRPVTAMLFFDGTDSRQLEFAKNLMIQNPLRIVPIETSGANPKELSATFSRPIYSANETLLNRFTITHTPSILYPGSGDKSLYLGLTQFAEPFNVAEAMAAWPAISVLKLNNPKESANAK